MPQWIASHAFGLEGLVNRELKDLGLTGTPVHGGVRFDASLTDAFRANLHLACADRVQCLVGEGEAKSFTELFDFVLSLPWEDWLPQNAAFPVTGQAARSQLMSVRDCQAITKKAIVERLKRKYRKNWFDENGPTYAVHVALHADTARLTIDSSGDALNRRGYRTWTGEAPLRETLAAAMVRLRPRGEGMVYDPFCGTGTLLIESAFYEARRAPGLTRSFAMENWAQADTKAIDALRQEAKEQVDLSRLSPHLGRDIDPEALDLARKHIRQAGLTGKIDLEQVSVFDAAPEESLRFLCNPPYGERLGEKKETEALYQALGQQFVSRPQSSLCALTAHAGFERLFGRRANKKRRLYNGRLECDAYLYW